MKNCIPLILLLAFLFILPTTSLGEIVRYKDDKGDINYVDSPAKVPEKYRSQLDGAAPLPQINKVPSFIDPKLSQYMPNASTSSGKKVEIYVTSWCPHCKHLEEFLKEKKIAYTRYDIEHNSQAMQTYKELGGHGVPFVKIGDSTLGGFNADWILAKTQN